MHRPLSACPAASAASPATCRSEHHAPAARLVRFSAVLCKATSFSSGLSFKYCRKAFRVSWEARRLKEVGASLRFSALLSAHAGVPYLGAHPRMGDRCQEGTRCSASWRRWCHLPYARPQAANRSISRGHTHLVVIVRPLRVQLFPTQVAASIPNRSRFFMGCHPPSPLVNPLLNGGKIKTLRPPLCVPHGHLMWLQPSVLREVGSPPQAAASRRAFGTSGTCRTTLGPLENL